MQRRRRETRTAHPAGPMVSADTLRVAQPATSQDSASTMALTTVEPTKAESECGSDALHLRNIRVRVVELVDLTLLEPAILDAEHVLKGGGVSMVSEVGPTARSKMIHELAQALPRLVSHLCRVCVPARVTDTAAGGRVRDLAMQPAV